VAILSTRQGRRPVEVVSGFVRGIETSRVSVIVVGKAMASVFYPLRAAHQGLNHHYKLLPEIILSSHV